MHLNKSSHKLIIGLGNPGLQYMQTRHNIGFMIIDNFLENHKPIKSTKKDNFELYYVKNDSFTCYCLKPLTYMNLSGEILPFVWKKIGSDIMQTLVICDNLDLNLGQIKFKTKGSSAGQKGLQNIINVAGTQNFSRIFMGIGRPTQIEQSIANYVLSKFNKQELSLLEDRYPLVEQAMINWIHDRHQDIYEALTIHAKKLS